MPDQSVKYLHMVAHATRDQDGQLEYIGAVQDVTQRRLSEEALGKARSELAHVARVTSLGALTASIAHEVNQPLSGIITNASTCLRMLAADPPNVDGARETARRTIRDGNRASDVITRLRALFSKKDATTESVDLNEATREVIALSLSELQRNRVILRPELADDLPPVTGDRVQLQQVILNLLRNASDAMSGVDDRPQAVADQNRTRRRRSCAPDRAGCGSGFRSPRRGQTLRSVLHNQERRHGDRTVRQSLHYRESSWPSLGSTERWSGSHVFIFHSSRTRGCDGRRQSWRHSDACRDGCGARHEEFVMATRSLVSVVDDDESVRESLPDLLREFGFAARAFSSAEEFLASDCVGQTRCLILDIAMPGMTGPDLQRELKLRRQADSDRLHHRAQG